MFSCAWKDNRCRIGLILGTGTNACYLEDVKNIDSLNQVTGNNYLYTAFSNIQQNVKI